MTRSFIIPLLLFLALQFPTLSSASQLRSVSIRGSDDASLCLDAADRKGGSGQGLRLASCHGDTNQSFVYRSDRGTFKSSIGNFCLDVANGEARAGNTVWLWSCHGEASQSFDYERESSSLHFRKDPSLCVTTSPDRNQLTLEICSQSEAQKFALEIPFGTRRFDQVTWLTAHNAHVNRQDASWLVANQELSLSEQLHQGVRGLMLDTYAFEGDVHLCHGDCKGIKGIGYASPRQTFRATLDTIVAFLKEEPEAIVTLFLEDYTAEADMRRLMEGEGEGAAEVRALLFDPYQQSVITEGWPTIQSMVESGKRLLIISDRSEKKGLGIAFGKDFTVENYWSMGLFGDKTECRTRWDEISLDTRYPYFEPLFIMNNFRDIPASLAAKTDNNLKKLWPRITGQCIKAARRTPNFLAVDFFEVEGDQGAREAVRRLNTWGAEALGL